MAFNFTLTEEKPFHAGEIIDLDRQLTELYTSIEGFGSEVCRLDGVIDNVHTALEHLADPKLTDEKTVVALFNADHALEMLCGVTEDKLTATMACEALDEQKQSNWEKFKNFCKQLWEKIKVFLRDLFSLAKKDVPIVNQAAKDGRIDMDKKGMFYDAEKLRIALQESADLEALIGACFKYTSNTRYYGSYSVTTTEVEADPKLVQYISERCAGKKFFTFYGSRIDFDNSYFDRSEGTLADHGWTKELISRMCSDYGVYDKRHIKIIAYINNFGTFLDRVKSSNKTVKLGLSTQAKSYSGMCSVMRAYYHAIEDMKRCIRSESDQTWS